VTSDSRAQTSVARLRFVLVALALLAFGAAFYGARRGDEFASTWFFDVAWWSYIVVVDALVHGRRGSSLLLSRPRVLALLAIWSAAFWLMFEVVNFRLQDWYYVGVPREEPARSIGAFVSFATVLPAIFETGALLESMCVFASARCSPWAVSSRARAWMVWLGAACGVLPLCFPRQAFPLIWGALVLLTEAWLDGRSHGDSPRALNASAPTERAADSSGANARGGLLSALRAGRLDVVLRWLAAGLVCGALWESWNFLATARWIYTVPYFEDTKLFEMPLAGFLGFPPFALECYSFGRVLVALQLVPDWEWQSPDDGATARKSPRRLVGAVAALAFSVPAILGVEALTVRATRSMVDEIPGASASFVARCERAGIFSTRQLLAAERRSNRDRLFEGIESEERRRILEAARLMEVRGLGRRGVRLLAEAGVASVDDLARSDPSALYERLNRTDRDLSPPPTPAEVRVWVRGARIGS
jgi:Domain of unknown function (DUF4332)